MQINRFIKALKLVAITFLLTSSANAGLKSTGNNETEKEPKPGPFSFAYTRDNGLVDPIDFHFYGDFVVMQPQEDGLDYAILNGNTSGNGSSNLPVGLGTLQGFSTEQHDWDWAAGFRIGVGGFLPHADWMLDLSWLRFKTHQEVTASAKSGKGFIPLWLVTRNNVPESSHESVSARWGIKINVVDALLEKPYYVSRFFTLNPHFGIRSASICQSFGARYSGRFGNSELNLPTGSQKTAATNDFWGVGPKVGMNSEWLLGAANLKLINGLSFAAMFGQFDLNQCAPGLHNYTYNDNFESICVNMDLQLGFGWGIHFSEDRHFFSITAIYEFQQWWGQNQMRMTQGGRSGPSGITPAPGINLTPISDKVSRGDLRLNSFSFRFQFDF